MKDTRVRQAAQRGHTTDTGMTLALLAVVLGIVIIAVVAAIANTLMMVSDSLNGVF